MQRLEAGPGPEVAMGAVAVVAGLEREQELGLQRGRGGAGAPLKAPADLVLEAAPGDRPAEQRRQHHERERRGEAGREQAGDEGGAHGRAILAPRVPAVCAEPTPTTSARPGGVISAGKSAKPAWA